MPWPFRPKAPKDQPRLPSPPERGAPDPEPSDFNVGDVVISAGTQQSGAPAVQDAKRRPLKDPFILPDGIDGVVKGVEQDHIFVAFGTLVSPADLEVEPQTGQSIKVPKGGVDTPAGRLPAGQPMFVLAQQDDNTLRVRTMMKFRKEDWFNKQLPDRRKWGFRNRVGRLLGDGPARASMPFGDYCFCVEEMPGDLRGPEDRACPGWYGYLKNTLAMDGDSVDVMLGPNWRSDPTVTVIEQIDARTGGTYQFKTLCGFDDPIKAFLKLWPDDMLGSFDVYTKNAYFECILPLLNLRHRGLGLQGWHEARVDRATGLLKVPYYEGDKLDGGHSRCEVWGLPDAKGQIGWLYYPKGGTRARVAHHAPLVQLGNKRQAQTRPRIVVVQAGPRSAESCPGQDGKTVDIVKHIEDVLTNRHAFNVDVIDLAVHDADDIVRPCKGCVSTSAFHCQYPCSCYGPGSAAEDLKDLMYTQSVYDKLEACAGMVFVTPVHWGAGTTQLKAMFDRLVCANLTVTVDEAIELLDGEIKNPEKTRALSKSEAYDHMLRNHLEGRYAAFVVHGDDGADECTKGDYPPSYDPAEDPLRDPKTTVLPYVNQLRYSGVYVPGDLVQGMNINLGLNYAEANDAGVDGMLQVATDVVNRLVEYIRNA